jgi:uncharacterized protein involved in response to NO
VAGRILPSFTRNWLARRGDQKLPAGPGWIDRASLGTMILAVMTRARGGHTGRPLAADRATTAIYVLVTLASTTRVIAAFVPSWSMTQLVACAVLWIAPFGLFMLLYGPMLLPTHLQDASFKN